MANANLKLNSIGTTVLTSLSYCAGIFQIIANELIEVANNNATKRCRKIPH